MHVHVHGMYMHNIMCCNKQSDIKLSLTSIQD